MVTVVAACAALVVGVLLLAVVLGLRRERREAQRRLDAVLARVDDYLQGMSASVADALDSALAARSGRSLTLLTLDYDELLEVLVTEAATRTGAGAAILRVEGPAGRPVIASFGTGAERETLDRSFGPPDERDFDTALIDWTYSAEGEPADDRFESALVVPLARLTGTPGALAVYARRSTFQPDHAATLTSLLRDAAVGLSNARRFAELEARVNVDPVTGIANRRGYERELGRATARSNRAGQPLSVVVVAARQAVPEVARLVKDVTRRSDVACLRSESEVAILLPGTAASGAAVLTRRIEDEAKRRFAASPSTVTTGLVEYTPNEGPEGFDERIGAALGRRPEAQVTRLEGARERATRAVSAGDDGAQGGLRRDALDAVSREHEQTRRFGRSLAVVVLRIGGLEALVEENDETSADDALDRFAGRLDRSLGAGTAHRLDRTTFALVLPGSGVHDAEGLVDALQSSLDRPHADDGLVLSAGITELAEDDDADSGLARAEHALWQAAQAGAGTVVVAVPNRRSPRGPAR